MLSFQKIRARAADRKGGDDVLMSLLGSAPDNAAVARIADDRILSTMSRAGTTLRLSVCPHFLGNS